MNKEGVYQCKKHGSTSTSSSRFKALMVSLINVSTAAFTFV